MPIITSTTSAKDIMSYLNTLHKYHRRIENSNTAFHLLQSGPAQCGLRKELAKKIARKYRDEGFAQLDVYKKWFNDMIFPTTEDSALIIMPQESVQPGSRDEAPQYVNLNYSVIANQVKSFQHPPSGVNCLALAAVLEALALTIPSESGTNHVFMER